VSIVHAQAQDSQLIEHAVVQVQCKLEAALLVSFNVIFVQFAQTLGLQNVAQGNGGLVGSDCRIGSSACG